ncbi:MAG: hypothetical protein WCO35_03185 [Candidatus Nomurabacteria bacterium]
MSLERPVEIKKEKLDEIDFSDYLNIKEDEKQKLKEWLEIREELPDYFWDNIKDISPDKNLRYIILNIKKELDSIYKNKKTNITSLSVSRFISLNNALNEGMYSCGIATKIYGTCFRKFNIPVKFIHGKIDSKKVLHSWLEIYDPRNKNWFDFDSTKNDFKLSNEARKINTYHDWEEMKDDFYKGNM